MKTYTIKITGSGTSGQIASRLYEIAAHIHNTVNSGSDDIEMEAEDDILFTEIAEEFNSSFDNFIESADMPQEAHP